MFGRSRQVPVSEEGAPAESAPASSVSRRASAVAAPARVNPGGGIGLGSIGFLTVCLGAWAGIVPFVGPAFGYSATGRGSWIWNLPNAILWLVPGAVAVFFGFVMMTRAPSVPRGAGKSGHFGSGFIVALCGGWLALGPFCWAVLEGFMPIRPAAPLTELIYWVGYSIGPGVLLGIFGGIAMGIAVLTRSTEATALATTRVSEQRVAA